MSSENGHSIREDPSLKSALSELKNSRKKWKHVLLNWVVSTRPLRHLVRIHCRLLFFGLSSFVYWATKRFRSSFAPALPSPLSQILPRAQILPLPPPTPHPQSPPQRRPRREREAQRDLYLSTGGQRGYLVLVGIGVCVVVLKVLVRRSTEIGLWSWLAGRSRRQC